MRRSLALAGTILAVLLVGCGLFKPRDPHKGTPCTLCLARKDADSVETNIQRTYGVENCVTCYTDALDATFSFHPDPTDSSLSDPTIFANWNHDVEARVATNLAADAGFAQAVFDSEYAGRSISPDQRTQTRYYAYHVIFQPKGGASTRYQGLADITYQQGSDTFWRITTWVDKRDASGNPTWGLLRRTYRVGF
jgi:hypothetical protein